MHGERRTLRHKNPDIEPWDCPVGAVDAWRALGWVPVDEWVEPVAEPRSARKSRKEDSSD